MRTVIVTGGNRGMGLGFVKYYLENKCHVMATYRDPNKQDDLLALKEKYPSQLSLHQIELTNHAEIINFSKTVTTVDLLILNAGIKGYPTSGMRSPAHEENDLEKAFRVNTEAPDRFIRALYPLLSKQKNACILYLSSLVGLTSDNSSGGYHPYRASKAATNSLIWNWCIELMNDWKKNHPKELTDTPCAVAVCPGWVRTDMGGPNARLSVEGSVHAITKVIQKVIETKKCNGLYMYDGSIVESYKTPTVLQGFFDLMEKKKGCGVG